MTDDHTHKPTEHTGDGYEKRDVAVGKLILITTISTILVVVMVIGLLQYFTVETEQQIYDAVLAPESMVLLDLRVREAEVLNSYAVVDSTKGVYRVPVEHAMKLMADEAFLKKTAQEGEK